MSREKIYSLLRMRSVQHLGQLSRVYIEPSGSLSLVWSDKPCPGLSIIPKADTELRNAVACKDHYACSSCGNTVKTEQKPESRCKYCNAHQWIPAALSLED
ncbi:hypothetical protein ACI2KR_26030 [Pseudomonas luteola]